MKNIIVFGATGGTGKYFINYLLENCDLKEYKIYAIGHTNCLQNDKITSMSIDITKKQDFDKLPKKVFAVVLLAGLMPARMKGYNPYKYIDVNIIGTLNVLEYSRQCNADRILFAQSFGDIKDYGEKCSLLKTDLPRKFSFNSDHTIYVLSKNFAVDMIKNYYEMYGIKYFIFRLPTIYLWEERDTYYVDGIEKKIGFRILIENAIKGNHIEVWGDPNRVKDMVYVKDFCQMLYKAILVDRNCGYYNVGTGVGTSLIDQIKGIVEIFSPENKKSKIIFEPNKPNAPQYIMDIEPAKKELGYYPKYNYLEMLKAIKNEMVKLNDLAVKKAKDVKG